jgi:hypothetical protein
MEDKNNEIGMGLVGFLLSMSTIQILTKGNVFKKKEIDLLIAMSREFLKIPGFATCHPDTLQIAERMLKFAETNLHTLLPPSA